MTEAAELKVKLVLDDQASKQTKEFTDKLTHETGEAAKKAGGEHGAGGVLFGVIMGFGMEAAEAAVESFHRVMEGFEDVVHEAMGAALGAIQQEKGIAGMLTMVDRVGNSYESLRDYAVDIHEDLELVGQKAGVAGEAVNVAFGDILERGNRTVDSARELTEQMALAGKAIPGGIESIATGMSSIELGVIRARNPVVQLIAATHLMKGTAKDVASALLKMSPENAMKKGEEAIGRMAEKMKNVPPSFAGAMQSLKDIKENIFESLGKPIIDSLVPPLNDLKNVLLANKDTIMYWGHVIGSIIGQFVGVGFKAFEAGWNSLQSHADELTALLDKYNDALQSFGDNFSSSGGTMEGIIGAGVNYLSYQLQTGDQMVSIWEAMEQAGAKFIDLTMESMGLYDLWDAGKIAFQDMKDASSSIHDWFHAIGELVKKMVDDFGHVIGMAGSLSDKLSAGAKKAAEPGEPGRLEKAIFGDDHQKKQLGANALAQAQMAASDMNAGAIGSGGPENEAKMFADAYNNAGAIHDSATQKMIAKTLLSSRELAVAMGDAGPEIIGAGKDQFLQSLRMMGEDGKALSEELKNAWKPDLEGKNPRGPAVHIGSATFNIKQDFRDQDPDRIAIIFRKDIGNAAVNRLSAMTG